jgi:predicted dinucleotide-binding enzyme
MAEDIVKALASNDEFAKKVANMLYEKIGMTSF